MADAVVVSCEHAGNEVPSPYADRMEGRRAELASHRGWDPGALELAQEIAGRAVVPLLACRVTRLLVDVNRDTGSAGLFSEGVVTLSDEERRDLLREVHAPHRRAVEGAVEDALARARRVVYLSVHSFTPVFQGVPRDVDVGILFDPARLAEQAFAEDWAAAIASREKGLRVALNAPYSGTDEGLDNDLRARFGERPLIALTLEVSQSLPAGPRERWREVKTALAETFVAALQGDA